MAKYTDKQNQWTQDYIKRAYDDIKVRVPKGKRDIYKEHASKQGKSLNQLIIELIELDMSMNGIESCIHKIADDARAIQDIVAENTTSY